MNQIVDLETGPDARTYRRPRTETSTVEPPPLISARAGAMLTVDRIGVPPALVAALKQAASLHNQEFYDKERMRFSTWDTSPSIRCYGESVVSFCCLGVFGMLPSASSRRVEAPWRSLTPKASQASLW